MNSKYNIEEINDIDFINMQKQDAKALCEKRGLKFRITSEDGEFFAVTRDYRLDRVNFNINNNTVVSYKRG